MTKPGLDELKAIAVDVSSSMAIVQEANDAKAIALVAVLAAGRVSSPINVHCTSAPERPPVNATAATAAASHLMLLIVMCRTSRVAPALGPIPMRGTATILPLCAKPVKKNATD